MKFKCAHCRKVGDKPAGEVNRAAAHGSPLFCDLRCFGLSRRKHKTTIQKVAEKRAYDMEYRRKNRAALKAKRAAYFRATYDPEKARIERKKTMKRHVEYCRRPEYKAYKREYDRQRRDMEYGPFAEAARLTIDLNREIKGRMTGHEIKWQNQTTNKAQFRRREGKEKERSRPRNRDRRDSHSPLVGE